MMLNARSAKRFVFGASTALTFGGALSLATSASAQMLQPPPAAQPTPGYSPYAQPAQPAYGAPASGYPGAAPQTGTAAQLQQSESQDSGRNFELVYVKGEVGASYAGLDSFSSSNLGLGKTSEAGPMFGLGAGVRLLLFTLGARARYNAFSDFNLWQLDLEAGLHIPVGALDPYIAIHGGYDFEGKIDAAQIGTVPSTSSGNGVSVHGFDAGLSVGGDYYLTSLFSLGIDVTGDALFLQRPTVGKPAGFSMLSASDQAAINASPLYQTSGDSVGFAISGSLHAGLHFGI